MTKRTHRRLHYFLLGLILFLGAYLRFHDLGHPEGYYFDEVYHVPTARLMAKGDPRAYEWDHGELQDERQSGTYIDWLHPPFAKLLQALSINALGDTATSWRFPSALTGAFTLLVVYLLARLICHNPDWALLAPLLGAIDGLAVAQSRITMNDMVLTFFMTTGVFLYYYYRFLRPKPWVLGALVLACGLSVASKWSGVFLLGFIGIWELVMLAAYRGRAWLKSLAFLFIIGLGSVGIYLLSYFQLFLHHDWAHFLELNNQIIRYQVGLDATHPYQSTAWEWPLGLKPVYLHLDNITGEQIWNRPFYPSWYFALVMLVWGISLLSLAPLIRRAQKQLCATHPQTPFPEIITTKQLLSLLLLIGAYFFFWAPWILSPRIMFFYHYLPAVPLLWVISCTVIDILTRATIPRRIK